MPLFPECTFLSFVHAHNVVMVGHSAIRYASDPGFNSQELLENNLGNRDRVVAASITPQQNYNPQPTGTLLEKYNGVTRKWIFPARCRCSNAAPSPPPTKR